MLLIEKIYDQCYSIPQNNIDEQSVSRDIRKRIKYFVAGYKSFTEYACIGCWTSVLKNIFLHNSVSIPLNTV